jgi:hypothetical protein
MCAVAKVLATGASVVVGGIVQEAVSSFLHIPLFNEVIPPFFGTLVTGVMSCTLLYFLDHSDLIRKLVHFLNHATFLSQEVQYFQEQAAYFERYASELMNLDLEKFKEETLAYESFILDMEKAQNEDELQMMLGRTFEKLGIEKPWKGDFQEFMSQKSMGLVFE